MLSSAFRPLLVLALLAGCDDSSSPSSEPTGEPETTTTSTSSADTGETDPTDPPATTGTSQTPDPTGDPPAETDGSTSGNAFIPQLDAGAAVECDVWQQDCPEGEKCMPWASDGGISWNATRCSPIVGDSVQPGDSCTAEGGPLSGIDNCELGAMCWNIDGETNTGTCVGFCEGSAQQPSCGTAGTECSISLDGVLILCLPSCDPILQNCPTDAEACYPGVEGGFQCYPDYSGATGAYADPCGHTNDCDPGLFCTFSSIVPECASDLCCSEFCDLSEPNPDASCTGEGQSCIPWYEAGTAPPGDEDIGYCGIPA